MTDQSPGADEIEAVARAMGETLIPGSTTIAARYVISPELIGLLARAAITALDHLRTGRGLGASPQVPGTWQQFDQSAMQELGFYVVEFSDSSMGMDTWDDGDWQEIDPDATVRRVFLVPLPTPPTEEQPERSEDAAEKDL